MEAQEILQDIVFVIIYGGVIMLNLVAALYLLLRRGNALMPEVTSPVRLRRWAAAFMVATALSHVIWLFYAYNPTPAAYVIICGLDMLMLLPTMAGTLMSMLQDRHRTVWPVLVMLIPAFILMSLCLIRGDDSLFIVVTIYVWSMYALMMLYMYFAVRRYGRWLRDNYADLENKEVWQSLLILAVFLLFFITYSSTSEERTVLAYLLQINSIIIVGLLLWRVETLQQLSVSISPAEAVEASAPPTIPANIGPLLKKHCEKGQLYLQHDLTLVQLSFAIGTNRYYLSQYFAQQGLTYNAYINGLRVNHFMNLYREAAADKRIVTAQQLALESGYRSYSTFSAAFKQNVGKTVTAWIHDVSE